MVDVERLPVDPEEGSVPFSYWGMWLMIATEGMLFASLISSYFYVRFQFDEWPPGGVHVPELLLPTVGTVLLVSSSVVLHWGELGARKGETRRLRLGLWGTIALGAAFLATQGFEYLEATFTPQTNVYGSLFYGITGFHGLHVVAGVVMLLLVTTTGWKRRPPRHDRHLPVRLTAMYWHFVDLVWLAVFTSLYLWEHVG